MLQINFYPDSDDTSLLEGLEEYKSIWETEKEKIITVFKRVSGLEFKEKEINATVFYGISHSHPLSLRANFMPEFKKANLIHELGHRLLVDVNRDLRKKNDESDWGLELHKALDLILFDVLAELYGEEYARRNVEIECDPKRPGIYREAWDWALAFSKEERQKKFKEILDSQIIS